MFISCFIMFFHCFVYMRERHPPLKELEILYETMHMYMYMYIFMDTCYVLWGS